MPGSTACQFIVTYIEEIKSSRTTTRSTTYTSVAKLVLQKITYVLDPPSSTFRDHNGTLQLRERSVIEPVGTRSERCFEKIMI